MMKRSTILGISLLVAGIAGMTPASVQAASMAVLVVGLETDAASDAFAEGIRYEYTQKGYTMVNDAVVQAKLTALRQAYKDGQPVDTAGLAAWGKTNNIDFVQLVVEKGCDITISGREQLAQVVTCGTEQYRGRAYYRTQFVGQEALPCEETGLVEGIMKDMVYVPGGVFQMASNYYVQLSDFYIGKYEVTQELWTAVMGSNPSEFSGDNLPVEMLNWDDIVGSGGFLETLNAMTGKSYRLPTEAEWEYVARGCKMGICDSFEYSGSDTIDNVAWYVDNSSSKSHTIGTKSANGLGLYNMSGNVWEWCYDWLGSYPSNTSSTPAVDPTGASSGSNRVLRGGSWISLASSCRVANRASAAPSARYNKYGFRLV
jgi:formylglycine-generating enzyme required for sulfatase activity